MHWAIVTKNPLIGKFFNVDSLPDNIIKEQIDSIKIAVEHFKNNYKSKYL